MSNSNVYLEVEAGVLTGVSLRHGQPSKSISFSTNSTQEEYQDAGFYLRLDPKPELGEYETAVLDGDPSIDNDNKTVTYNYTAVPMDADRILSMKKQQAKQTMDTTLALGKEFNGVTYQCTREDVDLFEKGLTLAERTGLTSIECRAMDNTMHLLTITEFTNLCVALGSHYNTVLRAYWSEIDN